MKIVICCLSLVPSDASTSMKVAFLMRRNSTASSSVELFVVFKAGAKGDEVGRFGSVSAADSVFILLSAAEDGAAFLWASPDTLEVTRSRSPAGDEISDVCIVGTYEEVISWVVEDTTV